MKEGSRTETEAMVATNRETETGMKMGNEEVDCRGKGGESTPMDCLLLVASRSRLFGSQPVGNSQLPRFVSERGYTYHR